MVTSRLARIITGYFLLGIILCIPVFAGMVEEAFAAEEFSTSYDVTYDVAENGVTTMTEKITLKNLTSQYYATQFKLTIGATQISDIKASDPAGPMEVSSKLSGNSTVIDVKFNQQIAGQDKILPWTLQFKSKDFAQKQGKIWDISIPKVSSTTNLESYKLTLSVPISFGQASLISPTPRSQTTSFNKVFLTFDKDQLSSTGVSATFGNLQLYDFDLTYNLESPGLIPALTYIALPPDSAYQDVIYSRIEPQPINVTVDDDGNYLAWYRLDRNEKLQVNVVGSAKLYSSSKVKNPVLEESLRLKYTQAAKYWEKDHPSLQAKSAEIFKDNKPTDNSGKAKLIYLYVVGSLKYDSGRLSNGPSIERLGAVTALSNPDTAVCMEFTDLFIAFSRAAGIPSRELDGFAYTANSTLRPLSLSNLSSSKDILHAWPEYWDEKKGWVMVDPTWGNTTGGVDYFNKFDLNHFVFVVKGSSSETPVPAGSYKFKGEESHDVKVVLSDQDFLGKPQLLVSIDTAGPIEAGLPGKIKIKVSNQGNALQQSTSLSLSAGKLNILNPEIKQTGPIPAFGSASFEFDVRTSSFFEYFEDNLIISLGNEKFNKQVTIEPFIVFRLFPFLLIGLIAVIGIVYLAVLGGFIYKKRFMDKPSV